MKIAKSPDRFSFQKEAYIARCREEGTEPDASYLSMYEQQQADAEQRIADSAWQQYNLEFDLRTTDWIIDKCRDDVYAQHLYAAMCNIRWQRMEAFPILKDQYWSCSWRYAGGIVADIQEKGDYIDWYCSGIRNNELEPEEFENLTLDQQLYHKKTQAYVGEGMVTGEIKADLARLGWQPAEWEDDT